MAKRVRILSVLLGAQLLLALALNLTDSDIGEATPESPLLSQSLDHLDEIRINDGNDHSVTLMHQDDQWQLPALDGFPASTEQANQLVSTLASATQGMPVATTEGARGRFKVAQDDFERRLVLRRKGTDVATLYLGTSPGTDQSYVRVDGESPIYRIKLGTYQAPVTTDDWLDRDLLTLPLNRVSAIEVNGLKLTQADSGKDGASPWQVGTLPDGKSLDTKAAATLAGQLSALRIHAIAADATEARTALAQPELSLILDTRDHQAMTYKLAKGSNKDAPWYLSISNRDRTFRITSSVGETLVHDAAPATLLKEATSTDTAVKPVEEGGGKAG
ncbi:DUF4340 domain-containing protein [Marinobacter bohaiensis]|uniref:DUF4340 domain-containing protein n=1 Tax=Marinobacter bohaiensis TaxID=2201898 RepID=UPI000DABB85B|nr:DUF4340 domain-containing protein [Marinobacter bohaiensis]